MITKRRWDNNWYSKTSPFSTVIPLGANSRNIRIMARECTGLAWEWWRKVIDERDVKLSKEINVNISGSTLSPYGSITYK
ncbi:streptolysin O [Streptococcus pyogenes]|nr:streptolysin O [Streptococcus pyogenes]